MVTTERVVEVHLEELGEHSWLKALANTVGGSYGSAQYRFVARPQAEKHKAQEHVLTGATFPAMRLQDLDDLHEPHAWIDTARQRLDELDEELRAGGWRRAGDWGGHWWSRCFVRP